MLYYMWTLKFIRSAKRFAGFNKDNKQLDPEVHRKYIYGGHVAAYMSMAPRGRGRGRGVREVVQESGAQNNEGVELGTERKRRGRPLGRGVCHVEVEEEFEHEQPARLARQGAKHVEAEVDQLAQRVGEMELVIAWFQEMRPPKFLGTEGSERAARWLKKIEYLFNLVEYSTD